MKNTPSIPSLVSLSSGSLPPPLIFFSLSLSLSFHHMKREGKPSWPFLQPCLPSTSIPTPNFSPPPSPFPTLLLPIRSRERHSNNTLHLHTHTHTHPDTCTQSSSSPPPLSRTHTFIFCALHFKHMKGCSAGTKAKGRVGGKEKEEEAGRGYKSKLEREMYGRDEGPKGGKEEWGSRGPHRRPGQCQGALAEVIQISLSGDKTAIPPSHLLNCCVSFLTSSTC